MMAIFGRVPGTQNPPRITVEQYGKLAHLKTRNGLASFTLNETPPLP
jgi:hypothetical protein